MVRTWIQVQESYTYWKEVPENLLNVYNRSNRQLLQVQEKLGKYRFSKWNVNTLSSFDE